MSLLIRQLGLQPYESVWQAMRTFTHQRNPDTVDEIWLVEHPPVYTLGLKGNREHILTPSMEIPIVQTDRGGQVTYHGPGQLILYPMLDLKRHRISVRQLVHTLESTVINLLARYGIDAVARADAPGVYVNGSKIASLGLKVRKGASYHGIALNWRMDLRPFAHIHPCGLARQPMTQLCDLLTTCPSRAEIWRHWVEQLVVQLDLPEPTWVTT
ncbi:MAG TPA: lipoyl(octanoyl) transferase LipB [Sulfurivirga caldicuralii]|nr:lipoyl(octanoyl) transferase LipB [Sulfurivirga caldicuralii]